jgi:hypothetical protein
MLKNIVFKKEYLLICGTIILLIASYRLAFRKTIEQWHLHSELKAKLANANNANYQPDYVQRKNSNLNKIIRLYKADTGLFRNNSVNTVSLIAQHNNASVVNIPLQDMQQDTGRIITEELTLNGNYFNLLKTATALQDAQGVGWMRAMSIGKLKAPNGLGESTKLKMELYVEIIK